MASLPEDKSSKLNKPKNEHL